MTIRGNGRTRHAWAPLVLLCSLTLAIGWGDTRAVRAQTWRSAREAAAPDPAQWKVTESAVGPVQIGMTLEEADGVLGGRLVPEEPLDSACDYVSARGVDAEVSFMVVGGVIARVDVRDTTITTSEGARVGDGEDRIRKLYDGRVSVEPHKYVPSGRYFIVSPRDQGDTTHLLLFETDGGRVTEFRAGRVPEVQWVEGCS